MYPEVVVVGHVGRDLVLGVDEEPTAGGDVSVRERKEMLGGKGANQAVGLVQLGRRAGLVGAVGDDPVGRWLLSSAARDGIDVSGIAVREKARTSLIVSVVDRRGSWRYLEDRPVASFVRADDVRRSVVRIAAARAVVLQLQEPVPAILEAGRIARTGGAMVVLDGSPGDTSETDALCSIADVWRADKNEAELLAGRSVRGTNETQASGSRLLDQGLKIVVLGTDDGNIVAWSGGTALVPHLDGPVIDTTGGGDALIAGLVTGLLEGRGPLEATCMGVAAASQIVQHLGGRPALSRPRVGDVAKRLEALARSG